MCGHLNRTLEQVIYLISSISTNQISQRLDGSLPSDIGDAKLRRRVGDISVKGITSVEEIEILEEDSEDEVAE